MEWNEKRTFPVYWSSLPPHVWLHSELTTMIRILVHNSAPQPDHDRAAVGQNSRTHHYGVIIVTCLSSDLCLVMLPIISEGL